MVILFNKPFGVLCQFSGESPNLSDYIKVPDIYPAGRLDKDSEGLLVVTDDGALQGRISSPKFKLPKTYWALVEREPEESALEELRRGVTLKDGKTRPAKVERIEPPKNLWARTPPVRYRKNVKDVWLEITLVEGKNRQVRRMTAAIGHPTLRLIRGKVGEWTIGTLQPGEHRDISAEVSSNKAESTM